MELSHALLDVISRPKFVFAHASFKSHAQDQVNASVYSDWQYSQLNPKNRIDNLNVIQSGWRIDGATICGTQFFAIPSRLLPDLIPLRIDLFIPDQNEHPRELRNVLGSSASVVLRQDSAIKNLEISRHLCRALDSYCSRIPNFLTRYLTLPFGSKLYFESISADVTKMELTILPAHDLERKSLSVAALQAMWEKEIPSDKWPQVVDLEKLRFIRQLHDSVCIVSMTRSKATTEEVILKSNTNTFEHLYHELKLLLTITAHDNIMKPPTQIVTKKSRFGGKRGVVGFILPYYPLGSIRDILPERTQRENCSLALRLKWSIQITSAMLHIHDKAQSFYSDLRPDNILLVQHAPFGSVWEGEEDVLVCDFEQRGNWHEWCPPEVLYRQYAENIRATRDTYSTSSRWERLIDTYVSGTQTPERDTIKRSFVDHVIRAKNPAWFTMTSAAQEKAMVYTLGLALYCIFEGVSNVCINLANAYPYEPEVQFPHFKRTPACIQSIIKRCTIDSPLWNLNQDGAERLLEGKPSLLKKVIRVGDKLYPEGMVDTAIDEDDMARLVLDTGLEWWLNELEQAEKFLDSEAWKKGQFGKDRPFLREVLETLEEVAGYWDG